jgi:hypothetical protein
LTTETLTALLDAGAAFDESFGAGLSDHRPMALIALARLGADDQRLRAWAAAYEKRLLPARPPEPWPAGDAWAARLGDPGAWPAYRSLFRDWLAHEGATGMLPQVLPALLPGCGAVAFHGLIRTAYALQAGHAAELADGLALWAAHHADCGPPPRGRRERDPRPLLQAIDAAVGAWKSERGLIAERMAEAAARPGLAAAAVRLAVDETTLPTLARLAAQLYAGSGNFTVLHLVTGAHALRVLIDGVVTDDALAALAVGCFWRAYAVGYVASRLPGKPLTPAPEPMPWDTIIEAAIASDDEHLIKLIDSAREQTRAYGGDDWQRAATLAVRRGRT